MWQDLHNLLSSKVRKVWHSCHSHRNDKLFSPAVRKPKPHKLRHLRVQKVRPTGCHDKGTAVAFPFWARQLYIWSRQHLATSHIQKVLSHSSVSPGCGSCQACSPPTPKHSLQDSPPPKPSHDLQLDLGLLCLLWPASNQKQPQLADSARSYDIMRQRQTFRDPTERSVIWGGSQNSVENFN